MVFGKRKPAAAPDEAVTSQPRQKIIPDALWQGEMGRLLREAGLDPDDEQNLVPSPDAVAARIERDRTAFEARLRRLNDEIHARTGGHVQPFYLFPEPCWNGETGHFLTTRLQMSPYEDWNLAFLPPDERYCAALGLPRHPLGDALLFERDVDTFLHVKMAALDAMREECDRTHDFARFKQRHDDLKLSVRAFAGSLREEYARVWQHHVATRGH